MDIRRKESNLVCLQSIEIQIEIINVTDLVFMQEQTLVHVLKRYSFNYITFIDLRRKR